MRENEQCITPNFTTRIDQWLRREDTWLAKGLKRINSLEGAEYRISKTKRVTDVAIALPMATLASLPTGIFLVATTIQKPIGYPFYWQERRKTRDQTIKITKFRTMRMKSDSDPNLTLTHGAEYSPEDDPRNTRLGKILRAFEFDELPQLFEVLSGKLSLIDIRSMATPDFNIVREHRPETYEEWENAYFEGIPGVFSLNSAMNKDRKHILKRQHFDIFYAEHASLGLDLFILYRTGLKMIRKASQKLGLTGGKSVV
ncbi:MAG: sugar transferase [Patescibacteria group bacterium]